MNDIQKALHIIDQFLRNSQVSSAENPDGIYESVTEKMQVCESFEDIKLFINNNI